MSFQAQIKEMVDGALHAVLGPLFERLDKAVERLDVLEHYVKTFEQTEGVPSHPAPRGEGPEAAAVADAASRAARTAAPAGNRTSRPPAAKGGTAGK